MMEPGEILQIVLDFETHRYAELNVSAGGRLVIHDNDDLPIGNEQGTFIDPGMKYEFFISRMVSKLMEPPYDTACTNYSQYDMGGQFMVQQTRKVCWALGSLGANWSKKNFLGPRHFWGSRSVF